MYMYMHVLYVPPYKPLTSYGKDNLMETVVSVTCDKVHLRVDFSIYRRRYLLMVKSDPAVTQYICTCTRDINTFVLMFITTKRLNSL